MLLDEPTNGLDPIGMRDVRTLMVRLAETGVTVLLSSHLLHEVQQVHVGHDRVDGAGRCGRARLRRFSRGRRRPAR